ncbi:MAG: amino-acid N-acetyltransferase [Treponema sp.]|nr:amino-acid N-acetyltransferase [Treponema sp.]MCL2251085.1 amino-acid N-acetyltransferase [Treponema sp.]
MNNIHSWDGKCPEVDLIREVFHYQSRFEGSTMVFKIDYPVTEDPCFTGLVKDLALLSKTGFKVIIVPGAKEHIDTVLKQHNIETSYFDSSARNDIPIRLTTSQAIPYVEMAAFNAASRFMTFLSGSRVEALVGNFVRARGLGVVDGIDTEHTGTVDKIYADSLNKVLNLGMIPILPCIGWSPSGKPYNVPSDEIALAVSKELGAVKLFIISANDGSAAKNLNLNIYKENQTDKIETRQNGSLIRLTPCQTQGIIEANSKPSIESKQILQELKLALMASKAGINRIHIVDGREEGAVLKELFSNLGIGTMVYADDYDSVRAFHSRDLPDILRLMEPLMQNGILVRRSAEQIQEKKNDYSVLEIDGSVRACGALHDWGEGQGEIAAVATDPQYTDLGLGRKIVGYLIEKAGKNKMRRVFVLTIKTQDWFEALGFKEVQVESLPEKRRMVYDQSRKSKVFALEL